MMSPSAREDTWAVGMGSKVVIKALINLANDT